MPATYEPIATTTLGSAQANITFSSIPATYTDLRLVMTGLVSGSASLNLQYNANTATNYSQTDLYGDGTSVASARATNGTYILLKGDGAFNPSTTITNFVTVDIFSYAGSTNKTCLFTNAGDLNGSGETTVNVGLWRSTSAITSIKIFTNSPVNLSTGFTATLFGILKA